jgi:hypothetical protein
MAGWPEIGDPELLARLTMPDEAFVALAMRWAQTIPARPFSDEVYERALGYPWERPSHSFLLTGDRVERIEALPALDGVERFPLLAYGANGGPERLVLRFAELPEDERRLVVVAGELHDFDVGPCAAVTNYGALPATIFASPGTTVRASVLWVTGAQLLSLTATEISYRLGRLEGVHFQPDLAGAPTVERMFAFVSRWGSHCVDGGAVALRAVPATGRIAPALTQEQLLDHVAATVFGGELRARDLVQRVMEDFAGTASTIGPVLHATARPFHSERWTPLPAPPVVS